MKETFYLACEQFRPYAVFDTLDEAKKEVQKGIDQGYDFRVCEVESVAWHTGKKWEREEA